MFKLTTTTALFGALCALAPNAQAQHTVSMGGSWVQNFTILSVPQDNTDQEAVPGGTSFCRARAEHYRARINGNANMTQANTTISSTSATGAGQGDFSYGGPMNGSISVAGDTTSGGSASSAGNIGSTGFDCSSSYQNSLGFSESAGSQWGGAGPVLLTVPSSFGGGGVLYVATAYTWSSSNACDVTVQARGAGSNTQVTGRARVNSQVSLF